MRFFTCTAPEELSGSCAPRKDSAGFAAAFSRLRHFGGAGLYQKAAKSAFAALFYINKHQLFIHAMLEGIEERKMAFAVNYLLMGAVLTAFLLQGAAIASLIAPGSELSPSSQVSQPAGYSQDSMNCGIDEHAIAAISMEPGFFGTKVMDGDGDVGKMIYKFSPANPVIAYWDVGLEKEQFDPYDVVYLHVNDGMDAVNAGDIRLTAYGGQLPGSRVAAYDNDINKNLSAFPAGWKIVFIDLAGSSGYDLLDPVYLHIGIGGEASQIERLDLRLTDSSNGPAGSLVNGEDEDRGLDFTPLPCRIRFYNANGNMRSDGMPLYDEPDRVYLDLSSEEAYGFIVVNDIRLT